MTTKDIQQIQTGVRLPESLLDRLDKLADKMSQPGMKVTRAEVLRLAAHRGVELLESEHSKRGSR